MKKTLRIAMAQVNFTVGAIEANTKQVIQYAQYAKKTLASDLIVFPELTLTGYPAQDLILRDDLYVDVKKALINLQKAVQGIDILLGYPEKTLDGYFNKAALIRNGQIIADYHKQCLPNDSVFNEKRYFKPGSTPCVVKINDIPVGICICEDLWQKKPGLQTAYAGAKLIISLNASPFYSKKPPIRQAVLSERAREVQLPIVYVNWTGAQDQLVFDGHSMALDAQGKVQAHAGHFKEVIIPIELNMQNHQVCLLPSPYQDPQLSEEALIYQALVTGLKDYLHKNGFSRVILGLSGGIDSALTLAIAVDALGKDAVKAYGLSSRYTQPISVEAAKKLASNLGVSYTSLSIEPLIKTLTHTLQETIKHSLTSQTQENLQARARGILLMGIANQENAILLSTGNKTEISIGYCTLYGDMAGGFSVLKDVPKTLVYRLARYRNKLNAIIPDSIIQRPPSAELRPNQKDEDDLLPYPVLDEILERYIEQYQSIEAIVSAGFNRKDVEYVVNRVNCSEYKRRQAPLGVRITEKAFGKGRQYPVTSQFHRFETNKEKT